MSKTTISKRAGFSLLEMLLYVAILTFMIVVIMNILVSVSRSQKALVASRNIQASGMLTLERITREVRDANTISITESVFATHPGRLVLESFDELGNSRKVEFFLLNGAVHIMEDGVDLGQLSQPGVVVTGLLFRYLSSPNSKGVRTELILESGTGIASRTINLYSTSVIRKGI